MNIKRTGAIIKKQVKETLKNKTVLLQFVLFPVMAIIMSSSIKLDGMPADFFVTMFATMYVGMVPLTSMAAIISEEKEKNTLRVLMMANVKPVEYLLGVGIYIAVICLVGACVFGIVGGYQGIEFVKFVGIMLAGTIASGVMGGAIGVASKSEMNATAVTIPIMVVFSFVPMISNFNETVKKAAFVLYSQQINNLINHDVLSDKIWQSWMIIAVNILITILLYGFIYRKKGLSEE